MPATIENSEGEKIPFSGTCSFGRTPSNTVALTDNGVSRRHAIIHYQDGGDYLLVDLGSTNGTMLNGRYLHRPTVLKSGDRISILSQSFSFFNQDEEGVPGQPGGTSTPFDQKTIASIGFVDCWLLVADIRGFTKFSQTIAPDELTRMVGKWLLSCSDIIENHSGVINKYLGDGFLAYWRDAEDMNRRVAGAIDAFKVIQAKGDPNFRIVLHYGSVAIGGAPGHGEESMLGPDLNFAFRMEKVASKEGADLVFSEAAFDKWPETLPHETFNSDVPGFDGTRLFYSVVD